MLLLTLVKGSWLAFVKVLTNIEFTLSKCFLHICSYLSTTHLFDHSSIFESSAEFDIWFYKPVTLLYPIHWPHLFAFMTSIHEEAGQQLPVVLLPDFLIQTELGFSPRSAGWLSDFSKA